MFLSPGRAAREHRLGIGIGGDQGWWAHGGGSSEVGWSGFVLCPQGTHRRLLGGGRK